jgi:hypothetical protein
MRTDWEALANRPDFTSAMMSNRTLVNTFAASPTDNRNEIAFPAMRSRSRISTLPRSSPL